MAEIPIREVLERRGDLSTFIVHLTRDSDRGSAAHNLRSIMSDARLRACTPLGWAKDRDGPSAPDQSQRVVCFTETPLEHLHTFVLDIKHREIDLQPYGLAFTKIWARKRGINPVWYVDMTPGQAKQWELKQAIEQLVTAVPASAFHDHPVSRVAPFIEQMGTWPTCGSQKEFWWEREWRYRGDMTFALHQVAVWLCPEDEIDSFHSHIAATPKAFAPSGGESKFIDPRWGLEHILAHLLGRGDEVTPFAP